jgi:hypothetical protein
MWETRPRSAKPVRLHSRCFQCSSLDLVEGRYPGKDWNHFSLLGSKTTNELFLECGRQNHAHPCPHKNIWNLGLCYICYKRDFEGGMQVQCLKIRLSCSIQISLIWSPEPLNVENFFWLEIWKIWQKRKVREIRSMRETWLVVAGGAMWRAWDGKGTAFKSK